MRIKVTGYIEQAEVPTELLDHEHDTGLTDEGFRYYTAALGLADVEFQAVDDDE